jgi:hypothetical protein
MENIIYENYAGILTEQQANILGKYDKIYLVNGLKKKIEHFENHMIRAISYFIKSNENETIIVEEITPLTYAKVVIITRRSIISDYFEELDREYKSEILLQTSKNLVTSEGITLFEQELDISTNQPVGNIAKFYENENFEYWFSYNPDGSFLYADVKSGYNSPQDDEGFENFDDIPLWNIDEVINPEYFRTAIFDPTGFEV